MGLLDIVRTALGLQRPLVVADPDTPLALSEAARARLEALGSDQGIHVETSPVGMGRAVTVTEGAPQGPPPPELEPLPITVSDADLALLRGRTLDHRDGRWLVSIPLELRARETPNPDGRLYLASQVLCTGRPAFFTPGADQPDLAARLLQLPGVASVLFRDNTVTVERVPDAPWDALDRGVDAELREHFLLCGGPLEGGAGATGGGALEEAVRQVIAEQVAPAIHRDGGDIELVGVSNGVVKVELFGACRSCPASTATLHHGVERTLKQAFPGQIERVEQV